MLIKHQLGRRLGGQIQLTPRRAGRADKVHKGLKNHHWTRPGRWERWWDPTSVGSCRGKERGHLIYQRLHYFHVLAKYRSRYWYLRSTKESLLLILILILILTRRELGKAVLLNIMLY